MKKQLFLAGVMALTSLLPVSLFAQSTEGTDFWVTFLQADHRDGDNKSIQLSLTVSSRTDCQVTIDNPYFEKNIHVKVDGVSSTMPLPFVIDITANQATEIQLYDGTAQTTNEANEFCYTRRSETVDSTALHVTATAPISLYASNYKEASFDAANVLPVSSLQNKYLIQSYTPSDHGSKPQGSHFAIVAVEDNTVASYVLSAATYAHFKGDTVQTATLKAGQVWYVWTGDGEGHAYDLSGTSVTSNKPIAVFQGNPHTNLPFYQDLGLSAPIQQRDHLFSQAMPIATWGTTFAISRSARKRDVLRIMALDDGTEVRINGELRHTFDFANEPAQYWEIQLGDAITNGGKKGDETRPAADVPGNSCFIETSCPCAVHLFIVSQEWDGKRNNNDGDPSMLWINPIEQRIDQITFSTYSSKNSKGSSTHHYVNVVTDSASVLGDNKMRIDGKVLTGWQPVVGSDNYGDGKYRYYYVKHDLGTTAKNSKPVSHTLKREDAGEEDGFIAYVYGYTSNESYGYNAGGRTKDLTAYITINGEEFKPGEENLICGAEKVDFSCELNYDFDSIYWFFGDGKDSTVTQAVSIEYKYEKPGSYDAYVRIYRPNSASTECASMAGNVFDSIAFHVNIGSSQIAWKHTEVPKCILKGQETDIRISLDNPDHVALDGDSVKISFDQKTKDAGFKDDERRIEGDSVLIVHVPGTAEDQVNYAMQIHIGSECPENAFDTTIIFQMVYDIQLLTQRFDHTLGITRDSFPTQTLSNFVWFHDGDTIIGEDKAILQLDRTNPANTGEFIVCFDIEEEGKETVRYCTCPYQFEASESAKDERFGDDANMEISATYVITGNAVFVNAQWGDQTTFDDCYAEWLDVSGRVWQEKKFNLPDGGCLIDAPRERGFYLLRVTTDGGSRSFKFFINH